MKNHASFMHVAAFLTLSLALILSGCSGIPGISNLQPPQTPTPAAAEGNKPALGPQESLLPTQEKPLKEDESSSDQSEKEGVYKEGDTEFAAPKEGQAEVDSIEILVSGSMPIDLQVAARGTFPDKCTQIDKAETVREGNTFKIILTTKLPGTASCAPEPVPFEEKIPLDVKDLTAGLYTVDVNGVVGTFEFAMDNKAPSQSNEAQSGEAHSGGMKNAIRGMVWHDLCAATDGSQSVAGCVRTNDGRSAANGIFETSEPGIEGIVVGLKQGDCSSSSIIQTAFTDANGKYLFQNLNPGMYCVVIDSAQGNNSSVLKTGAWTYPASAQGKVMVNLAQGEEKSDLNFGWDYQSGSAAVPAPTGFQFQPAVNATPSAYQQPVPTNAWGTYQQPVPTTAWGGAYQQPVPTTSWGGAYQPPMPTAGAAYPSTWATPIPQNQPYQAPMAGQPAYAQPFGAASGCTNLAELNSESTAPNGPTFQAGMNVVKTWRIRNVGSCVWQTGYTLVFVGGDQIGSATPTVLTGEVVPGNSVDISVQLSAPMQMGTYTSQWMLRSPNGEVFGLGGGASQPFLSQITVAGYPLYATPGVKPGQSEDIKTLGPPTWVDTFWNDANWNMLNDENTFWKVQDGALYMTGRKKVDIDRWGMSRMPPVQDFYLEMEVKTGPVCGGFDSYGMIVRAPDNDAGYVFGVTCNGSYRLYQWDHGYFKSIKPYTATKYLKVGPYKTNRIGIMAMGDELRLYVNGYLIDDFDDDWFPRGQFGLMVGPNQTANFTVAVTQVALWHFR